MGYNQKWYNVTSQRSPSINYTNTTGKPIAVSISYSDVYAFRVVVGGATIIDTGMLANIPSLMGTVTFIVPVGDVYWVSTNLEVTSNGKIRAWAELR
ncbi:TPA: hypothetical protein SFZ43_000042 [Campylobacter jejuni]|nr:hypothetical protein [Campylobacter jejuni]